MYNSGCFFDVYIYFRVFYVEKDKKIRGLLTVLQEEINTILSTVLCIMHVAIICVARDYAEGIRFDSSNHWKPSDDLNCARIILYKIYNDYNFELNYHVLDKENFYDLTSKYPEIKSNIEDRFGYCFSVPSPISSPCIELTYAEGEPIIGSYESVIFNPIESWNMDGGAYHNVYTISNSLINTLKKALVQDI